MGPDTDLFADLDGADPGAADVGGVAGQMARGVSRLLADMGYLSLNEFRLANGRRVDVIGLNSRGRFLVVEIKSSVADYRADKKWVDYLLYCDRFYFAVPADFPQMLTPTDTGLMVADGHGAAILRQAPAGALDANRRRAQTVRFGLLAAARLRRFVDPVPAAQP